MLKPRMIIIAGANGCGKTTLKRTLLAHPWTDGCEFINPDDYARDMFGGWDRSESFKEAQVYATKLTDDLIEAGESIVLETAFSSERKLYLVEKAKKLGYFIRIYFIGTDNPTINAARVCRRMMEGGHEVLLRDIIKRHKGALNTCVSAAPFIDRLYIFDNSADNRDPIELFRAREGYLVESKICPAILDHDWSKDLLKNIAEVLNVAQEASITECAIANDSYDVKVAKAVEVNEALAVAVT